MNLTDIAVYFSELGHKKRLEILLELIKALPEGLSTGEIAKRLSIPNSTLTHHISHLEACQLIKRQARAQNLICKANLLKLQALSQFLLQHCCQDTGIICELPTRRSKKINIAFLCVNNSARSQMAEGLARAIFADSAHVISAGSNPTRVHPLAIKAMAEIGIDISQQKSESIDNVDFNAMDYCITLCADEVCPYIGSTARKMHWPLDDPAQAGQSEKEKLDRFRAVRDDLKKRIETLRFSLINVISTSE